MREYARFAPYADADSDEPDSSADDPLLGGQGQPQHQPSDGASALPSVSVTWRRAWWSIFKKGNDVESARVNHQFTPAERAKLANFDSIDYLAPNSAIYRKWLARQPHRRSWDRWVMMGSIGIATGLVAHFLYVMISLLASFKYGVTRYLVGSAGLAVAWLFNVTVSVALVAASSAAVIGWAPEARGSGVPEVMAYLNGIMLPKVFNIATLVVKFVSSGLVVASGLPVGPEGPLIHIGAAIGAALSQGHSTTLGFTTQMFRRFRNPKDKRDFVTAGVSVGVAAAFDAPIGGLLFAFEEVASFWQHQLGYQVFFACMCAILTVNLSRSAGKALLGKGTFGWFDDTVAFEQIGMSFSAHILAVVPAAAIGLVSGLLAIVFTIANVKVVRLRDMLSGHLRWKRAIEPCVLAAVYITGCMLLPLFFECITAECRHIEGGKMQCSTGLAGEGAGILDTVTSLPLYTCSVRQMAPPPGPPGNGTSTRSGGIKPAPWPTGGGSIAPGDDNVNTTQTVRYNELATLLFSTGEEGIKHLLARGTHRRFGYKPLLVMGCYYFVFAVLCAGSAVSSGLFVPMLMIGAVIGRIFGLATVDVAQHMGKRWSVETFGPWTWIDPGAFALVGAGAFMGGVTRMTVALAVIMIEVSSDVHMLLPVLVAIMIAKWVADAATHSLYHGLLEVKCVPFLPSEPASKYSLDLIPVSYVMHSPVVCLQPEMKVRELNDVLRSCNHNGFPVVRHDGATGSACIGLVTRSHLLALLQRAVLAGTVDGLEVDWVELNRKTMDPVKAQRSVAAQQMAVLAREMAADDDGLGAAGPARPPLLGPVGNRSRGGAQSPSGSVRGSRASTVNGYHGLDSSLLGTAPAGPDAAAAAALAASGLRSPGGAATPCPTPSAQLASPGPSRLRFGDEVDAVEACADGVSTGGREPLVAAVAGRSGGGASLDSSILDLMPYINTSAVMVPDSFSVERTYILFRTMGLRHLVVVDELHRVKGIITRKDLMGYRLDDALGKALHGLNSSGSRRAGRAGGGSNGAAGLANGALGLGHAFTVTIPRRPHQRTSTAGNDGEREALV